MPKKTDTAGALDGQKKMMPADCFSAFMALSGLTSVTKAQLELMSHLDGVRTVDSYQHLFRSVVTKAKELRKRIDDGEAFEPVPSGSKKSRVGSTPATPTTSTPSKRKAVLRKDEDSPSKKSKRAPQGKKVAPSKDGLRGDEDDEDEKEDDNRGEGLLSDAYVMIKQEEYWQDKFV